MVIADIDKLARRFGARRSRRGLLAALVGALTGAAISSDDAGAAVCRQNGAACRRASQCCSTSCTRSGRSRLRTCACKADCQGKRCGPDGCGGTCGVCPRGGTCANGRCGRCVPDCRGLVCGSDGCGGSCGDCAAGEICEAGACGCEPDCDGKDCGDDGCGGSCGSCSVASTCQTGACVCNGATCTSNGDCGATGYCNDGCCQDAPCLNFNDQLGVEDVCLGHLDGTEELGCSYDDFLVAPCTTDSGCEAYFLTLGYVDCSAAKCFCAVSVWDDDDEFDRYNQSVCAYIYGC